MDNKTLQQKNKELLVEGFNTLFNKRNFAAAEKLWSPDYIQHSGHIPPGGSVRAGESVSTGYFVGSRHHDGGGRLRDGA